MKLINNNLALLILLAGLACNAPKNSDSGTGQPAQSVGVDQTGVSIPCLTRDNCPAVTVAITASSGLTSLTASVGIPVVWTPFTATATGAARNFTVYSVTSAPLPSTMQITGVNSTAVNVAWTPNTVDTGTTGSLTVIARDMTRCQMVEINPAICTDFNQAKTYDAMQNMVWSVTPNTSPGIYPPTTQGGLSNILTASLPCMLMQSSTMMSGNLGGVMGCLMSGIAGGGGGLGGLGGIYPQPYYPQPYPQPYYPPQTVPYYPTPVPTH